MNGEDLLIWTVGFWVIDIGTFSNSKQKEWPFSGSSELHIIQIFTLCSLLLLTMLI